MLVDIPFRWNAAKEINNSDKDVQSLKYRYLILIDEFMVKSEFTSQWEMTELRLGGRILLHWIFLLLTIRGLWILIPQFWYWVLGLPGLRNIFSLATAKKKVLKLARKVWNGFFIIYSMPFCVIFLCSLLHSVISKSLSQSLQYILEQRLFSLFLHLHFPFICHRLCWQKLIKSNSDSLMTTVYFF